MEQINLQTAVNNLKKNSLLLLSCGAALCLFIAPSLTSVCIIAGVFVLLAVAASLKPMELPVLVGAPARLAALLMAGCIALLGLKTFAAAWRFHDGATALAERLHMGRPTLILIVGLIGCFVGFFAMYALSGFLVSSVIRTIEEGLPERRRSELFANLKRNWFFPISAAAFFSLNTALKPEHTVGLLIAFVGFSVLASQVPSLLELARQSRIWLHVPATLTALGFYFGGKGIVFDPMLISTRLRSLESTLPIPTAVYDYLGIVGNIAAVFFVYFCVLMFWREMTKIISENRLFHDVAVFEWVVYSILLLASLALVVFAFTQSEAFYGTEYDYDIIYTSDSPNLVKGGVYLALMHPENDLRQPLFAVFAMPFTGIAYLLGRGFGASETVQAIFVDMVQLVMLLAANFMVAKMLKLTPVKRVCFMLLASCTYTYLLFVLMMEQYIVAYFWLVFCLYLIAERGHPNRIALWGAGGTLLTSMVLLPFLSDKNPIRAFKEWFADMVKYGLEFVAVMLLFCRFDVIFNLKMKIENLKSFTGTYVSGADKGKQYLAFVSNCFSAPDAGVNTTAVEHISWQQNPVTGISFWGVAIVLLVIISAIVNREKVSSLLAAVWVVFSAVMLLGLGWGTQENGLILYALYFGWAFLVLLFQLTEKIAEALHMKFLVPVFSIGCAAVLAAVNIPEILKMVNFAVTCFPA